MMNRREAVASFAASAELLASRVAAAQMRSGAPAPAPQPPVFKHDLPNVTMDEWEVRVNYVD